MSPETTGEGLQSAALGHTPRTTLTKGVVVAGCPSPEVAKARSDLGVATKRYGKNHPEVRKYRKALEDANTNAELDAHIDGVVENWALISDEKVDRIAALLMAGSR